MEDLEEAVVVATLDPIWTERLIVIEQKLVYQGSRWTRLAGQMGARLKVMGCHRSFVVQRRESEGLGDLAALTKS